MAAGEDESADHPAEPPTDGLTGQPPRGAGHITRSRSTVSAVAAACPPLRIAVLGPPQVIFRPGGLNAGHAGPAEASANTYTDADPDADAAVERDITARFQPRTRELLVFLALHPDGPTGTPW